MIIPKPIKSRKTTTKRVNTGSIGVAARRAEEKIGGWPMLLAIHQTKWHLIASQGARPMAWQALFERSFGGELPACSYRGAPAASLRDIMANGFDREPSLVAGWSHSRLRDAMTAGPIIQVFRDDRLPDDVARALIGVIIFEEDGLQLSAVRALVQEFGLS